jgi:hypothetical protein
MDFTLTKYEELCKVIGDTDYIPMSVCTYMQTHSKRCVILRHDVDRKPEQALKMAQVEKDLGIASTYYFRTIPQVFKPNIIKVINDLGHEIGYHYEVLNKAKGDFDKAIKLFEDELKDFRKICDVKTICMHGNPLSRWDNRDLWEKYDFKDFGILGEPYMSVDYTKVLYLTDTGRKWNSRVRVKDVVNTNSSLSFKEIKMTDDIINVIREGYIDQICILAHPNRWSDTYSMWLAQLISQNIKNVAKVGILLYRRSK